MSRPARLEPSGISAVQHLVTWLPPHLDETTIVEAALRARVGTVPGRRRPAQRARQQLAEEAIRGGGPLPGDPGVGWWPWTSRTRRICGC